jgi:hypothetical protein
MRFAFYRVSNLLFEIGLSVVVVVSRDHDRTGKPIMFELPMRPFPTRDLKPSSRLQISNELSDLAWHRDRLSSKPLPLEMIVAGEEIEQVPERALFGRERFLSGR